MDDDAGAPGGADAAGPSGKAAPPTSRAVAMFAVVFVVLGLIGAAAWFIGSPPPDRYCTADARIDPVTGFSYGRDPDQDCMFVDLDGNVLPDQ